MPYFLHIEAFLPVEAALDLTARLMAARPLWDIELVDEGLSFHLPFISGAIDAELGLLEETCQIVERNKKIEIELRVNRTTEISWPLPPPKAAFWELRAVAVGQSPPAARPDRLILPPDFSASRRMWATESLLLKALAAHLTPAPGAPDNRGGEVLTLETSLPLAAVAAVLAGASRTVSLTAAHDAVRLLAAINEKAMAVESVATPFNKLAKSDEWNHRFGLIAVNLSPYLAARRLKVLARWLKPNGVMALSGFAPGPQTAWLLRAAAKLGLILSNSAIEGPWASMVLEMAPDRAELPPLELTAGPALEEPPAENAASGEAGEFQDADEIPDDDSLIDLENLELPDDEEGA